MIVSLLKSLHTELSFRAAKFFRTREVVRTLRVAHAVELASMPGEHWPITRASQLEQIRAVRDGKLDVVDRRSWAWPYIPEALHRLNQPILKATPYNIRRFSDTPIPRRAINLIKNAVVSLKWTIRPVAEKEKEKDPEAEKEIQIFTNCLRRPNNVDSYRTLMEAVTEDIIVGGYGCIEPQLTPYYKRPIKMWAVDGSTIRLYADWTEAAPDRPRYAQMTGLKGERGIVAFLSKELIYIRSNCRSNTPFGLGMLEVAFNAVNAFLGAQDMASKAGADQVHKTWLWWQRPMTADQMQTIRRHITNELEGQQKISLVGGMPKPDVISVQAVNPPDLLLEWQEFLIRIIANAFDLSPLALGLERDVNRSTGEIMATSDFRQAVVPMARRIEEALTRDILHGILGWTHLEFTFLGLEDPDSQTKVAIQQRQYMMNAITPDEIREEAGRAPLPGGWGRLTMGQFQILAQSAGARGAATGQPAGAPQFGGAPGAGAFGAKPPAGLLPGGGGSDLGDVFSADDVAMMNPDDVQRNQEMGLLPSPTSKLTKQMEEEQPGILETLSEDLKRFFDEQEKLEEESQVQPAKVTGRDEKEQRARFREARHRPTVLEQALLDRKAKIDPERQPQVRGRYPRSESGMKP